MPFWFSSAAVVHSVADHLGVQACELHPRPLNSGLVDTLLPGWDVALRSV